MLSTITVLSKDIALPKENFKRLIKSRLEYIHSCIGKVYAEYESNSKSHIEELFTVIVGNNKKLRESKKMIEPENEGVFFSTLGQKFTE